MAARSGMIDFYAELEIEATADATAIKKSYRQLVLKYHPDKNPEDRETAEEKIRKINAAYETLSNPAKRANYDAQARSMLTKARGVYFDTSRIQPRMAIPKEFMLCPMGHPDKFMRTVGRGLAFHTRADVPDDDFLAFFQAARFSLWWLPEVNNMCRLRTLPAIQNGVISMQQATKVAGGPPSGSILSFGLSPQDSTSEVMLSDSEQPMCTNLIAVTSPEYPGAFRFESAYFKGHYLAFDPPRHAMMMRGGDQFGVIDFLFLDFYVAEQFRTLDEILIPVVAELGGGKSRIKLTRICQDAMVYRYFQTVLGGAMWDFNDFALYFHAHSDHWDYNASDQTLRLRGFEDKLGQSLKHARKTADVSSILLQPTSPEISWLPLDSIEIALRTLSKTEAVEHVSSKDLKAALVKLLSILKQMCACADVSFNGLISVWDPLANLRNAFDIENLKAEVMKAVVLCVSKLVHKEDTALSLDVLRVLLDMPLDWDTCAEHISQKGQPSIAKEPLDILVPLMRKAAKAKAGKFGECLATSTMMKLFGAQPQIAIEALDAMVSGGFGMEGAPMMLQMLLPRISLESGAKVAAELIEHGANGADLEASRKAIVANDAFKSLPVALQNRLGAGQDVQRRSRSRSRETKL